MAKYPLTCLKDTQMMRMAVTTQNVLKNLHGWSGFRPYNFFLLPILADFPSSGEPLGVNRDYFRLVAPMESDQKKWMDSVCINIGDPLDEKKYKLTTDYTERDRTTAVVATFKDLLSRYVKHPEAKSLAPNGGPCKGDTRGLLRRAHIIAGEHIAIGKETDRKWEEGDDLESLSYEPIVFRKTKHHSNGKVKASKYLIEQIKGIGIRELIRFGCGKKILEKICGQELVDTSALQEYEQRVQEYKLMGR